MNTKKMAKSMINQSKVRLQTAKISFKKKFYSFCVRQAQECVELALKSALRLVGVEYPKVHDVSLVLKKESSRFPEEFRTNIQEFCKISSQLAEKREIAMYGDEERGLLPEKIFNRKIANEALKQAEKIFKKCEELIRKW